MGGGGETAEGDGGEEGGARGEGQGVRRGGGRGGGEGEGVGRGGRGIWAVRSPVGRGGQGIRSLTSHSPLVPRDMQPGPDTSHSPLVPRDMQPGPDTSHSPLVLLHPPSPATPITVDRAPLILLLCRRAGPGPAGHGEGVSGGVRTAQVQIRPARPGPAHGMHKEVLVRSARAGEDRAGPGRAVKGE